MVFTSISFIYYFLPIFLIIYLIVPKKIKNIVLLIFSIIFYFYGEPKYILLIILEIVVSYFLSLIIQKKREKKILIFTILFHILILCIFKYLDFISININNVFKTNIPLLNLMLPIGISFYTFQIISYEIDVYKGKVQAQKNILKLATYVFLFPQLIAGPIVRYETISNELDNRKITIKDFSYGISRFVIGLSKKVLIANNLGEICNIFSSTQDKSILFYWIFAISYALQIYFDFSGYSDIAIGLGRCLGFHFLENFDYPYISKSITEFWRRWHISLSSWFRDYVYIPLGGNREGKLKQIRNILIVWALTGIWHGASWNFILWGVLFGVLLIIEKFFLGNILKKLPILLQRIYTLIIVMISFIIFEAPSLNSAFTNIKGLFGINGENFINNYTLYNLNGYILLIVIAILGATPLPLKFINCIRRNDKLAKLLNIFQPLFIVCMLFLVTIFLIDNSYNPFLYFRF